MLTTSILMFMQSHNTEVAITHTIVGFAMLLMLLFHVKNNLTSLIHYIKSKLKTPKGAFNFTLPIAFVSVASLVMLSLFQFSPFMTFYNWGNTLRASASEEVKDKQEITYQVVNFANKATGTPLTIELKKGPYFHWPQYAIWLETIEGEFVQPLYVTEKLAKNQFVNRVSRTDDTVFTTHVFLDRSLDLASLFDAKEEPETKDTRIRPEALPVFLHKLGRKTADGLFVPTDSELIADVYTGATLLDNFEMLTKSQTHLTGLYKVRMEINHSFDFNEYYSSDRFPDDKIYSGNGYSAQPSIIYEAIVDMEKSGSVYNMELVGRGHHSGKTGDIYPDLENLTTALQLVDKLRVEVNPRDVNHQSAVAP